MIFNRERRTRILFACLFCIIFPSSFSEDPCPVGWVAGYHKCYRFTGLRMKYSEAVPYCDGLPYVTVMGKDRYPSLLIMNSETEFELFSSLDNLKASRKGFLVNCNDIEQEGEWICRTDGTQTDYLRRSTFNELNHLVNG